VKRCGRGRRTGINEWSRGRLRVEEENDIDVDVDVEIQWSLRSRWRGTVLYVSVVL